MSFFSLLRILNSVNWCFFTGVWVTASLQDCSQYSEQSQQCCNFYGLHSYYNFTVPVPNLRWLYQVRQLQLVSLSFSCSIVFQFSCKVYVLISPFVFFQFYPVVRRNCKVHYSAGSLFYWLLLGLVVWPISISSLLLYTLLEFFTSALTDGLTLEFEWQQVSSSLQDSSHGSGCSQQCCRLDSLYPSTNFQVLQAF